MSPKPDDIAVEQLLGLTFNLDRPGDPYLYAADSLQLRLLRVDPQTGRHTVVADDPVLFNFPSSLAFLPPAGAHGPSQLLVVSNQQHLTTLTNDAITEDMLQPPFLATKVLLRH